MLFVERNFNSYSLSFDNTSKFNVHNAKQVESELMEYVTKPSVNVTLNLNGIAFIDSSAFECLLNVLRKAKLNNTGFQLGNVSSEAMELIRVMDLDKVFSFS